MVSEIPCCARAIGFSLHPTPHARVRCDALFPSELTLMRRVHQKRCNRRQGESTRLGHESKFLYPLVSGISNPEASGRIKCQTGRRIKLSISAAGRAERLQEDAATSEFLEAIVS